MSAILTRYSTAPEPMNRWAFVLIFVFGVFYRLLWLNGTSLWLDEGFSVGFSDSLTGLKDRNGPLFYYLLYLWRLFIPSTEWGLRAFSVVADVLSFILFAVFCHRFGLKRQETLIALMLYVFIPINVVNSMNIRMYSLWGFFNLSILVCLLSIPEKKSLWQTVLIGFFPVLILLSFETHKYTGVYLVAYLLSAYFICGQQSHSLKPNRVWWSLLLPLLIGFWIVLFRIDKNFAGAAEFVLQQAKGMTQEPGPLLALGAFLVDPRYNYFHAHGFFHALAGLLCLFVWFYGIWIFRKEGAIKQAGLVASFFLPVLMLTFFPLRSYPRLFQPIVPIICICLAVTLIRIKKAKWVFLPLVFGVFLYLGSHFKTNALQDFRQAEKELKIGRSLDTLVLAVPDYSIFSVLYYLEEEALSAGYPLRHLGLTGKEMIYELPAFEYLEVLYLEGHQAQDYFELIEGISPRFDLVYKKKVNGILMQRFKRKPSAPIYDKKDVCKRWRLTNSDVLK